MEVLLSVLAYSPPFWGGLLSANANSAHSARTAANTTQDAATITGVLLGQRDLANNTTYLYSALAAKATGIL
jgi:hypothetical protein